MKSVCEIVPKRRDRNMRIRCRIAVGLVEGIVGAKYEVPVVIEHAAVECVDPEHVG